MQADLFFQKLAIPAMQNIFAPIDIRLEAETHKKVEQLITKIEAQLSRLNQSQTSGLFMSYDFHIINNEPQLIEINTNAGGALLFHSYLSFQKQDYYPHFESEILAMFEKEWQKFGAARALKTIAIVDDTPQSQYLYAEFILMQNLLQKQGYEVFILDYEELKIDEGFVHYNGTKIDFIYNRSTDFYFETQKSKALRYAFEANSACISPNPHHYAAFADKRNMINLSQQVEFAKNIPHCSQIEQAKKSDLWTKRNSFFFKPLNGYGSKAVYCGQKITKKTWDETINENYLAQNCTKAPKIAIMIDGKAQEMRYDVRYITYAGQIIFSFARVYSGQTTNFRNAGSGFASITPTRDKYLLTH